MRSRLYSKRINPQFFKKWTAEMAYILGYVAADGCLIKRKDRKNSWTLNITSKDKGILRDIRKAMDSNHIISPKTNGQGDISYQLQIHHYEICYDLMKLGIFPRKTFTLRPIKILLKFFPDFVRGFFDADGCVFIYKVNGTPQLKVKFSAASYLFLKQFAQDLSKALKIPKKPIHTAKAKGIRKEIYYFDFYISDGQKLFNFMYDHKPSLYLSRKFKIFKKWKLVKRRHYIKQNYPSKIGWRLNQKVFV